MILTAKEIALILEALRHKYGLGYSHEKEIGVLQAKLSIMAEMYMKCEKKIASLGTQ